MYPLSRARSKRKRSSSDATFVATPGHLNVARCIPNPVFGPPEGVVQRFATLCNGFKLIFNILLNPVGIRHSGVIHSGNRVSASLGHSASDSQKLARDGQMSNDQMPREVRNPNPRMNAE
jgi:hypothetical protein